MARQTIFVSISKVVDLLLKMTASMLTEWMSCPLKAKYHHLDELPTLQSAAASFGVCVHDALDWYHKTGCDVNLAIEHFKKVWDHPELLSVTPEYWLPRTSFGAYRERGIRMITDYHENTKWAGRHLIASEHKFSVDIGEHQITGIVDWIEFTRGKEGQPQLKIGDFKTSTKKPYQSDLLLNVQFTLYCWASEQESFWMGYDDEKYLPMDDGELYYNTFAGVERVGMWYHLNTAQEIYVGPRTQADYNRLYRCIDQVANAIEKEVFVPCISGSTCGFCDFTETCVAVEGLSDRIRPDKEFVA